MTASELLLKLIEHPDYTLVAASPTQLVVHYKGSIWECVEFKVTAEIHRFEVTSISITPEGPVYDGKLG